MNSWNSHPLLSPDGDTPAPSRRDGKSVALSSTSRIMKDEGPSLDAANQSLADALKLIFVLLNFALVVIAGFYLLSGFQQVKEGESGIRLLFGKINKSGLEPGFHFAMPYPIGVLEKIQTGNETIELRSEFWPNAEGSESSKKIEELPPNPQLTPGKDGSLITADLNLAHTRVTVTYVRANPANYAANIYPGLSEVGGESGAKKAPLNEQNIVRSSVSRGVVQATAGIDLDSFIKQPDKDAGSVAIRAKQIAQAALDRIQSGIRIESLTLESKSPPTHALREFQVVQTAEQNASKQREVAMEYRNRKLNTAAGAAAVPLLELIDKYDRATELKDKAGQDAAIAMIDAILIREAKGSAAGRIEAEKARAAMSDEERAKLPSIDQDYRVVMATGEVGRLIDSAQQYSRNRVAITQRERDRFRAKLEQFGYNPTLTVHREWSEAFAAFMGRDNVFKMYMPRGVETLNLMVNPDPDILRNIVKARQAKEVSAAEAKRWEELEKTKSEELKGLQKTPDKQ